MPNFIQKNKEIFIAAGIVIGGGLVYLLVKSLASGKSIVKQLQDELNLTLNIKEVGGDNVSFSDPAFQKEITSLGWQVGWAWCVLYAKYIWSKILPEKKWNAAKSLISNNSQVTWANFDKDKSGYFVKSDKPKVGSIAIWRYPEKPWNGHAGIVTEVHDDYFMTQEGNYGGGVSKVKRKYDFNQNVSTTEKFRLVGFINIK